MKIDDGFWIVQLPDGRRFVFKSSQNGDYLEWVGGEGLGDYAVLEKDGRRTVGKSPFKPEATPEPIENKKYGSGVVTFIDRVDLRDEP